MSAAGSITLKMAYNGVQFFYFRDQPPMKVRIERIIVRVGEGENYSDTYFVDFGKLGNGSAPIQFVSNTGTIHDLDISLILNQIEAME